MSRWAHPIGGIIRRPVEAPRPQDLIGLALDVSLGDEPWVFTITAFADDGDRVTFTWDEVAASVHVRWSSSVGDRLVMEREYLSKIAAEEVRGRVELRAWFQAGDLGGDITVVVGRHVTVTDTLLRK